LEKSVTVTSYAAFTGLYQGGEDTTSSTGTQFRAAARDPNPLNIMIMDLAPPSILRYAIVLPVEFLVGILV
jgi:hypothetical protein